jgi:polyisoprenoid-binding protein YceI
MKSYRRIAIGLTFCSWLTFATAASPVVKPVDSAHSSLHVHVYKSGLFSALGHDHDIEAPVESGSISDAEPLSVDIHIDARKMRVLDPDTSPDTRAGIQKTMLGTQVLDTEQFPEIRFHSTEVHASGTDHWMVTGNLELHGKTHPVTVDVSLKDGIYSGSASFKQTEFGITPVKVAGGTVKVKDEVKIDFEIAPAK